MRHGYPVFAWICPATWFESNCAYQTQTPVTRSAADRGCRFGDQILTRVTDLLCIPGHVALSRDITLQLRGSAPHPESSQGLAVHLGPVPCVLPYRVYYDINTMMTFADTLRGDEQVFMWCLGSRHHDGRIREECIRRLLPMPRPWVSPFVVALLGEYVREIAAFIHGALDDASLSQLQDFARQNPAFMQTTMRRAISYWNAYHRGVDRSWRDAPGWLALRRIEAGGEPTSPAPIIPPHV